MSIGKEKRDQLYKRFTKNLFFVNLIGEIVSNLYDSIWNLLDQISIDSNDDYRQYLLQTLLPNVCLMSSWFLVNVN